VLFEYGCQQGIPDACAALGSLLVQGSGTVRNDERGLALMQRACSVALGARCHELGQAYLHGRGVPIDAARAVRLFWQACNDNEVLGCVSYAAALADGLGGLQRNPQRALQILGRACKDGSFRGCHGVGRVLLDQRGTSEDAAGQAVTAASYLRYACGYRVAEACDDLAELLASGAIGTNLVEAAGLSLFSCEEGVAAGCFRLADYYRRGIGVTRDAARAEELLKQSCKLGDARACSTLDRASDSILEAATVAPATK
jgi:TPR repeat protein